MANLIDTTYFVDQLMIPNLTDTGFAGTALQSQIGRYIVRYEADFLRELLGVTLYDEFIAGLAVVPISTKWVNLRNQLRDATNKISPIANYVWYYWQRDHVFAKTGLGDAQPTGQNLVIVINEQRIVDVWAEMIRLNELIDTYLNDNIATYPTYTKGSTVYEYLNTFSL